MKNFEIMKNFETPQKNGFSLMEMMIVLLIVSIVAAATAPTITRKLARTSAASSQSGAIDYFGLGNNFGNASDGTFILGDTSTHGLNTKLFLNAKNENQNHIGFGVKNKGFYGLLSILPDGKIKIGDSTTTVSDNYAIAIGSRAQATKERSVAIGAQTPNGPILDAQNGKPIQKTFAATMAQGMGSVAIGAGAQTVNNADYAISIGEGASANKLAIAIGASAKAVENAIALSGQATGYFATAIQGEAYGNGAIAIGGYQPTLSTKTKAEKAYDIAIGTDTIANGQSSIAIGDTIRTSGKYASTIGFNSTASGQSSVAIGDTATASGKYANAIGNLAVASEENAIAIGNRCNASKNSIAIGNAYTYVQGVTPPENAIAIGSDATAFGKDNIAIGRSTRTSMNGNSVAIGYHAIANKPRSVVISTGSKSNATINDGYAYSNDSNEIVLGTELDNVIIRGNLVVMGNTLLGGNGNSRVYANFSDGAGLGIARMKSGPESFNIRAGGGYVGEENGTITSNGVGIGNTSLKDGEGNVWFSSDRRLKNVGKAFTGGLDDLKKLQLFNFTYKTDENKTPHVGVMAQDLQKVFPNAVTEASNGYLRIRFEDMFYAVVNAVKELDARLIAAVEQIKSNTDRISKLEKTVDEQKQIIHSQQETIKMLNDNFAEQTKEFEKRLAKLEKAK